MSFSPNQPRNQKANRRKTSTRGRGLAKSYRASKRRRLASYLETLEPRMLLAAEPGLDPVIVVPGFGGTFSKDESPQAIDRWYTHRGLPPDELALEPNGQVYQSIVATLENVGYVPGKTLFVTTWDWRVPVAPVDADWMTNPDGLLSGVSTSQITDDVFETGLDYLGYTLKQAADQYALDNPGQTLEKVDIISHSTGGLVARSYIQSTAYGQGLPEIDDFVMSGVPNEGASEVWNFSLNDWNAKNAARALARIVDHGYDRLQSGQVIDGPLGGPDSDPSPDDIADPGIDKALFVQQYVGALRHLLPTYPSLDTDGDGSLDVIDSGDVVNDLLLDLNGGQDKNGYIDRTGQTYIQFSQQSNTRTEIEERVGPHPKGFLTDSVLSFTNFVGRSPEDGQVWYLDIDADKSGDGTVPVESAYGHVVDKTRNGLSLIEITKEKASEYEGLPVEDPDELEEVGHTELVIRPYGQKTILDAIGVTNFSSSDIESELVLSTAESALKGIELGVIDPVEAITEVASRVKELIIEAKARGSLAKNVAYFGVKLANMIDIETLWQEKVVEPLAGSSNGTVADIVAALQNVQVSATDVSTDDELAVRIQLDTGDLSGGVPTQSSTLDLGGEVSISGDTDISLEGNLAMDVTIGWDLNEGFDFKDALFIRDLNLTLGAGADLQEIDLAVDIGSTQASVNGGSFALDAQISVSLKDPSGNGTLTVGELGDLDDDFDSLVSITPEGSVELHLPLNVTDASTNFDLASFGSPVLSVASEDLFAGRPDVLVDIALGEQLQDQILVLLSSLDASAASITEQAELNEVLPGIGKSLNELSGNGGWGNLLRIEQVAADYFDSFDPASTQFNPDNVGSSPTALGLRNAIAASLFGQDTPISLSGGVDLETNTLRFDLVLARESTHPIDLSFDALGSDWNDFGIVFGADATTLLQTRANLDASFGIGLGDDAPNTSFFEIHQFEIDAEIDADGSEFSFGLGPITGTATANTLAVSAGAQITLSEGASPLSERFHVAPTASLAVDLDLAGNLYGTSLGAAPPNLPSIQITNADLFNETTTFVADLSPMQLDFSAGVVIDALLGIADWMDDAILEGEISQAKIPLLNKSVGDLLSTPAQEREFRGAEIVSVSLPISDGTDQRFEVTLNTGAEDPSGLGIKPGNAMSFRSTQGDIFPGRSKASTAGVSSSNIPRPETTLLTSLIRS